MQIALAAEYTSPVVDGVPGTVRDLVLRAMSTDPAERFATAAEMQGAIEASLVAHGISTTSASVATYVAEHMLDHVAARTTAIEAALESLKTPGESILPTQHKDSIGAVAHTLPAGAITSERIMTPMALPANALFSGPPPMSLPPRRLVPKGVIAAGVGVGALALLSIAIVATKSHGKSDAAATAAAAAPITPVATRAPCPAGMVEIPGGHFFMGSDDDLDLEKPAHHVTVASYCMDVFEVSVEKYKACSDAGDCKRAYEQNKWDGITKQDQKTYDGLCNVREPMARGQHPINCVDWSMAEHYCESQKGGGGRLPTEAEWEFAARGPDGRKYPWGDEEPSALDLNACGKECVAWGKKNKVDLEPMYSGDDGWPNTAPVGSFPAGKSRYGVQDVVGNVWEWTGDYFATYTAEQQEDPKGPAKGTERVIRGGAWNGSYPAWVRPTFRYHNDPDTRSYGVGFRCMKPVTK
jgi:formylglycine-generating enzyme required for sulfatase activity